VKGRRRGGRDRLLSLGHAIVEGLWREYKIDHIEHAPPPPAVWIRSARRTAGTLSDICIGAGMNPSSGVLLMDSRHP